MTSQQQLTELLDQAVPVYKDLSCDMLQTMLTNQIAPIAIKAKGPIWQDRSLDGLRFCAIGEFLDEPGAADTNTRQSA